MKVINDCQTLRNFDAWSGAVETKKTILEHDKEEDFECLIDELFPDGLTDTQLNDILWFDSEWVFECLDIRLTDED